MVPVCMVDAVVCVLLVGSRSGAIKQLFWLTPTRMPELVWGVKLFMPVGFPQKSLNEKLLGSPHWASCSANNTVLEVPSANVPGICAPPMPKTSELLV